MYSQYYRKTKFNNQKTIVGGFKYDSKFEASMAVELAEQEERNEIRMFDRQYRVEIWACDAEGRGMVKVTHKVDFRIHHNDGFYELREMKGFETADYRFRKKLLLKIWLPQHPDHYYTVFKQGAWRRYR